MKSRIVFADEKTKKDFVRLQNSKAENKELYKWITNALEIIEEDAFCGIQIPKKLIPKEYIQKYDLKNLWKYNLPHSWRLLYTIKNKEIIILSIVIEWLSHKEYEKKFKY